MNKTSLRITRVQPAPASFQENMESMLRRICDQEAKPAHAGQIEQLRMTIAEARNMLGARYE